MQLDRKARLSKLTGLDLASLVASPLMSERTVSVAGRQARLRLETTVWDGLDEVARREGRPLSQLCGEIDAGRTDDESLKTAIRTYVLHYFRAAEAG